MDYKQSLYFRLCDFKSFHFCSDNVIQEECEIAAKSISLNYSLIDIYRPTNGNRVQHFMKDLYVLEIDRNFGINVLLSRFSTWEYHKVL